MHTEWLTQLGVPTDVRQGHLTVPLRQIATWVAARFDLAEGPLRIFIRLLFREVAAYLGAHDSPHRLAAREEVAERIAQRQPKIVIAQSLRMKRYTPIPNYDRTYSSCSALRWPCLRLCSIACVPPPTEPFHTSMASAHQASVAGRTSPIQVTLWLCLHI